ncbi:MAG: preprotein translocase subunit SecE [Candidatus Omnitrophica bacterium]|nr:preprotein translocase subunit SecE [Candidatus Omnitrophota bacterium]
MIAKTKKFIIEVKQELSKVSWSSRRELMGATAVVITSTFMLAFYIGIIDLLLSKFLSLVIR